ncbi:hypothetical protein GCM10027299_25320 [Larkinella ripae]
MFGLQIYEYKGHVIEFEVVGGQVYANATTMCQAFGKKPVNWLALPTVKRYVAAIQAKSENLTLVLTRQGGLNPGTWIHEKLILKLAQWLDVDFEIQCDEWVSELVRTGKVELQPPAELSRKDMAMMIYEAEVAKERLLIENSKLKQENEVAQPKIDFYDAVTDSKDVADLSKVAKILNFKNIGRNKLFEILRLEGVLRTNNEPYQKFVDCGWFRVLETSWSKPDGSQHVYFKTVVFQKGIDAIRKILLKTGSV